MLLSLIVASMSASAQDVKKLPEPNKDVKMTMYMAMQVAK